MTPTEHDMTAYTSSPTRASHCSCGRPAVQLLDGGEHGPTGYCGYAQKPVVVCQCGQGAQWHSLNVCHIYGAGPQSPLVFRVYVDAFLYACRRAELDTWEAIATAMRSDVATVQKIETDNLVDSYFMVGCMYALNEVAKFEDLFTITQLER